GRCLLLLRRLDLRTARVLPTRYLPPSAFRYPLLTSYPGLTGIPIYNVNNNCATGSSGLHMARTFLQSGTSHCALVIGFEKMSPGSLKSNFSDREAPLTKMAKMMYTTRG